MKWTEYAGVRQEHRITHVHQDGTILTLEDGSVWDIPVGAARHVIAWYPSQRVIVRQNAGESESYALINLDTSAPDVVVARVRKT
jgi:hypothetical protein